MNRETRRPHRSQTASSQHIGEMQARQQREDFQSALRALLMRPLLAPGDPGFTAVRRQADKLREWFTRETGWGLVVERDGARLYKRPADTQDATRGLPDFDRRRYVLLCLACAVLERANLQTTLRELGEKLMEFSLEFDLAQRGFSFTLTSASERRELVTVCKLLLDLGVLTRVAGDEDDFIHSQSPDGDALYDVQRRALSGMLAAVRGPSTWTREEAPVSSQERLNALVSEHVPDTEEGHRTAIRHALARRLLDDPVVYMKSLDPESLSYFTYQRGAMAVRLCEATGLVAEQRAEGLALTDDGTLTDIAMPAEGTEAHVTLLVAEYLATRAKHEPGSGETTSAAVVAFIRDASVHHGHYWRKSAREPGAEDVLAATALTRLENLRLIERSGDQVLPLPAICRFAIGDAQIQSNVREAGPSNNTLL
ncbi:TIGR02678 family protein [Paraburkholderia edwinii]|uniref:TIGR02678 family protein n=1 Tax=Paraburkholderia edwinii TaxID=2861782 RepID=A0ABX8UJ22_9BURK|nr:TIGR02678 family protein [Paraburkholderia edwinii]QYD69030.1 TIGR02678 family protein [Paraburkholderia edwinii]